jgi:hypothetical protein
MRAYKFLNEKYGIQALSEKRLKLSRLKELNDPFELTPYDLTDTVTRSAFLKTREQLGEGTSVICFSADWEDPVIWAHYSDKHKAQGSCRVSYIKEPLHFPENFLGLSQEEGLKIVRTMLFTKFKHWEYEHEIRRWATLNDEENGLYFLQFNPELKLKEIIIGAKCGLSRAEIEEALGSSDGDAVIIKARAAYGKFAMVKDENFA